MAKFSRDENGILYDEKGQIIREGSLVSERELEKQVDGQLFLTPNMEIDQLEEPISTVIEQDGSPYIIGEPDENFVDDPDKEILELLKPGKFSISNFWGDLKGNTKKALYTLLSMQSNAKPLKKGGPDIAYRCSTLIFQNRQNLSANENTIFDILLGQISSFPENDSYIIYTKDIVGYFSNIDGGHAYEVIKDGITSLKQKPLEYEVVMPSGKTKMLAVPWYDGLLYTPKEVDDGDENSYISFLPTPFFKMLVISASVSHGAYYRIKGAAKISGKKKHQRNLYYMLEDRKRYREFPGATPGRFSLTLSELQEQLNYPKNYGPTDVRRYILKPTKEAIDNIEEIDFTFTFDIVKEKVNGKMKLNRVDFMIMKKGELEIIDSKVSDEPVAIEEKDDPMMATVYSILKGQGLNESKCRKVYEAYSQNNRDIVFLTQAIAHVAKSDNVRDFGDLLTYIMKYGFETGGEASNSEKPSSGNNSFMNFNQRSYDYDELEKVLLNSDINEN